MGVPEGSYHPADNRKTLNNTAYAVANFRTATIPPPPGGALTGGVAYNFDQPHRGFVRIIGEFTTSAPLDLGAPGIDATLVNLLREKDGGELVDRLPVTVVPRTRSRRVTVFETPPGNIPLFRLTVRTCIAATRRSTS